MDKIPTDFSSANSNTEWRDAIAKEREAILENGTWKIVEAPSGVTPIGTRWVFQEKDTGTGKLAKARLVVKGYAQRYGD